MGVSVYRVYFPNPPIYEKTGFPNVHSLHSKGIEPGPQPVILISSLSLSLSLSLSEYDCHINTLHPKEEPISQFSERVGPCSTPPTFFLLAASHPFVVARTTDAFYTVSNHLHHIFGMEHGSLSSSTHASSSRHNPRKRPHNYDPTTQLETTIDEDIVRHIDKASHLQSSKRMRVEEWPLKTSDDATESNPPSQPTYRKSLSPSQKRNSNSSTRPSKFLEGSMNDKVSRRPPSLYTRQEEAMEQYTNANMEDVNMVYDAGIESHKPSSMFRFGKAISNAFSSGSVWQGLNGLWKEKEKESQAKSEKDVLKAKAELKYAELKRSGYKGTENAPARPESQEVPGTTYEDADESRRSSFRDSAVDIDEYRSSSDRNDSGHFLASTESLMPPPPLAGGRRSASPFSDASSGRRSSLRFHKPSLEGLKKVKSQVHLPSMKRHVEEAPSVSLIETGEAPGPGLRREASKKDIAKQYKLVKKVSDLENKLEIARRELELSVQQAPPVPDIPAHVGRKRFVPGALPSLPSERLLTPQTHNTSDGNGSNVQASNNVDMCSATVGTAEKVDNAAEYKPKVVDESVEDAQQALWNRRASDIAARNAAARQSKSLSAGAKSHEVLESEAAKGSVSKKRVVGPIRSREHKVSGTHGPSAVQKRPPKVHEKTRILPMSNKDKVPPVPVRRTVFDPTKVDQTKIMAMRAIPDNHLSFGKAWDDMKNLRKQHPYATEAELDAYMSSQSAPKKTTDHASVSHGDRPSSPFLGRPGPISPMKTRARAPRNGISPPPPSLSSAKKFHKNLDAGKSFTPVNQKSPVADDEVYQPATETPSKISEKDPKAARASLDKPLPDIKPDDFEWDDDVF